ncbi:MAG: HDIG domain-containing protein [Bacteroidales bacterium]|nr:HDIG domain-containing protein [Bacteroidales bacterium]
MKIPKFRLDIRRLMPFAVVFLVLLFMLPKSPRFSYDYRKGSPWRYETLIAQFDFPIYKTDEQMEEERSRAASPVVACYRFSDDVVNRSLRSAEGLQFGSAQALKSSVIASLRKVFTQGVLSDETVRSDRHAGKYSDELIYVQKDKRISKLPVSEVYKLSDAKAKLLALVREQYTSVNVDSVFREVGVYDLVVPNLVFDRATTDLLHSENGDYISPTQGYVSSGELIVSEGEIVTAEIEQILDSYRLEYNSNLGYSGSGFLMWLGNILLAFMIALALFLVTSMIKIDQPGGQQSFEIMALTVFTVCLLAILPLSRVNPTLLYLLPYPLVALCLRAFFRNRMSALLYMMCLTPLLLTGSGSGAVLYLMFTVAGFVMLASKKRFPQGRVLVIPALITFAVVIVFYAGFRFTELVSGNFSIIALYLFLGEVITALLFPSVSLLGRVFNIVTDERLTELANPDNPLLRELEDKAPGTFQHSLQVMNMADAAARSIGADVALVRAGALYHDIGKMMNPMCFVENESLLSEDGSAHYHDSLTPLESAAAIISHVRDGETLARSRHLPQQVIDFILTHHGTGTMSFFYNKYLNEGGSPEDIGKFRYNGVLPRTREQIILMLCDSVEAASRTLKDNSPKGYSELVERLVGSKISEGQFAGADISIKDISVVKNTLKEYLAQLYHDRVAYPKIRKSRI